MKIKTIRAKDMRPDGSCTTCICHYTECEHRIEDREIEIRRSENIKRAVESHRQRDLAGICLSHELESDEFSTRWEKAEAIA
jgi:hypothetical protein